MTDCDFLFCSQILENESESHKHMKIRINVWMYVWMEDNKLAVFTLINCEWNAVKIALSKHTYVYTQNNMNDLTYMPGACIIPNDTPSRQFQWMGEKKR